MKYFLKQSSIFIVMSLMLCLINISYQEKSNAKLENSILNKNHKSEIKTEAKINTKISKNTEMKSKTEVKAEMKTEVKAENKSKNVAKAKSEVKVKSAISTLLELHATSKSVSEAYAGTEGFRIPKGYVMIRGNGNLCIKTARNKRITQTRCSGKNNVLWKFVKYKGKYIIQNKNGYVLDNYAFKRNNGGPIYAWKRNNKNNQKWNVISRGRGKFALHGVHSGKCLDNTGKARSGVGYHQWSCNKRNRNQFFSIVSSKKSAKVNLPSGYVQISGKGNMCIHASNMRSRVKQGPCNSTKNALWKFAKHGSAYIIQNKGGLVLDVKSSKKNNGVHIIGMTRRNADNQKFYYIKLKGGKFQLKNVNSRRCLDNTGKARRGIGYHQWSCNSGNSNQHFRIVNAAKKNTRNKRKSAKKSKSGKKMSPKMTRLMNKNKGSKKGKAPKGWGMIRGRGNLCIQTAINKRIRQGPCNKRNNSLWRFIRLGRYYIIQNKNGYVLDNYAFKRNNGGPIYAWRRNNKKNQKWSYLKLGGGKFELKGLNSGKCLDNTGKARNRIGYHQWSCNSGNKNQHFKFVKSAKGRKNSSKKGRGSKRGSKKGRGSKSGSKKGRGSKSGSKKGRGFKSGSKKGIGSKKSGSRKGIGSKKSGSRKGRGSRKSGSRKGRGSRKSGSRKGRSVKTSAKRQARKAARKFRKSIGKGAGKPKSGYKKRKNIKFMGGKYKFNLVTGRAFCTKKCKPNKNTPMKKCFKGTVQNCNSCVFNGGKKDKDSDELCKMVCNAIDKEKTCEFYTFIDAKQKVINKRLLTKFGRIFLKKYLKR